MHEWLADAIRESSPAGLAAFFGLPVAAVILAAIGVIPLIIAVVTASSFVGVLWSVRRNRTRQEEITPPE